MKVFLITTVALGLPAQAAIMRDPDSPRLVDGLRVLGMREDVQVIELDEYRSPDRERMPDWPGDMAGQPLMKSQLPGSAEHQAIPPRAKCCASRIIAA